MHSPAASSRFHFPRPPIIATCAGKHIPFLTLRGGESTEWVVRQKEKTCKTMHAITHTVQSAVYNCVAKPPRPPSPVPTKRKKHLLFPCCCTLPSSQTKHTLNTTAPRTRYATQKGQMGLTLISIHSNLSDKSQDTQITLGKRRAATPRQNKQNTVNPHTPLFPKIHLSSL